MRLDIANSIKGDYNHFRRSITIAFAAIVIAKANAIAITNAIVVAITKAIVFVFASVLLQVGDAWQFANGDANHRCKSPLQMAS